MRLNSNSKCAFYFYSRISNNSFFCSRKNDGKSPWNNNFSRHCPKGLLFRKGVTKMSSFGVEMQLKHSKRYFYIHFVPIKNLIDSLNTQRLAFICPVQIKVLKHFCGLIDVSAKIWLMKGSYLRVNTWKNQWKGEIWESTSPLAQLGWIERPWRSKVIKRWSVDKSSKVKGGWVL